MKVSIIIPIYKVEKYIERCINSVLNQTYRNLEVILINDCTPDKSMEIARNIIDNSEKSEDIEIKYINHENNKGIAATRNTGLRNVSGEYFFFLDSDDEITPDCIESMVLLAEKYKGVDMVHGNIVDTGNKKIKIIDRVDAEFVDDKYLIKKMMFNDGTCNYSIHNVVWNKLIKTSLIKKYKMYFKENIIAEDLYWLFNNWFYITSICFCLKQTYYYYDIPNSITNSKGQKRRAIYARLITIKDLLNKLNKEDYYIFRNLTYSVHNGLSIMRKLYPKDEDFYVFFHKTIIGMLRCTSVPLKIKIGLVYLLLPPFFVKKRILDLIIN